ncbi:MAG TPA: ATP-binding protein [Acidobacteriaceae bacterium]|nr:ATP-binding protein [Acidobacteriaceae bacterium]
MAELVRNFDWAQTPVGAIEDWPELLLNTVNTLLSSRQPMFLWWGEDLIQFYNDAYRPCIGADKHPSALGQRGSECWSEIWDVIGPLIENVMTKGEACWSEDQLIPIYRDGKLVDVYWTFSYSPVWDAAGNVCGTLVVCSDTTGRIQAEKAILTERSRLLEVLRQAPAFFALLQGPDHVITIVNSLYLRLVNHRDVVGKPVRAALPEAAEQGYLEILDRVYQGEPYVGQGARLDVYAGEGVPPDERYLDFIYQPLREGDDTISGIIVLGVDVTDRKRAQDVLLQTEKLAAVGRLASSIAHEINNPLESVTNLLYLAHQTADDPETRGYLAMADVELRRMSSITNQTLRFHRQRTSPAPIQPGVLLENALSIYQGRLINSSIETSTRIRASRPLVCFDGEIRQVLNNLVGNAIDAMAGSGGRLSLRSREGTDWASGASGIVFTVADTGVGMSPETASRIFEPFFTTKGLSGTGLGLWISHDIIQRHRGRLKVRSTTKRGRSGTTFTLFLPFRCDDIKDI